MFRQDEKGVWFLKNPGGENDPPEEIWVCSPLQVIAVTRDHDNQNHGRLLQFFDLDNVEHKWPMPMELLASDGAEYRRILLSMGLQIAPGRAIKDLLTSYIQSANPKKRVRCVNKTGWIKDQFVFPDETITSEGQEEILFQTTGVVSSGYEVNGNLKNWQKNVSKYCVDNSRLGCAVSIAFCAPLLFLMEEESGGFHFRGPSSGGKTTTLKIAASVYGNKKMLNTWRATSNGLESIAAQHNDCLLCLDELGQVDPREAGDIAYLLANNSGKSRANRYGYAREKQTWRLYFLSSGEISLGDLMRQSGKKMKAGQEVRIIDIPAETGKHGIFEFLHDMETGEELARLLSKNSQEYFGIAGRLFIKKIIEDSDKAKQKIKEYSEQFMKENKLASADGQVHRVLRRFAIIAAAGTLATEYGITDWPEEEAVWAAKQCFNAWVKSRGGLSAQESKAALSQARRFFELHGDSRFALSDDETPYKTINRAGYKKDISGHPYFFVFQEAYKNDICDGIDLAYATKVFIEKSWLIPDSEGKSTRSENLPGFDKSIRCYRFDAEKVFTDDI